VSSKQASWSGSGKLLMHYTACMQMRSPLGRSTVKLFLLHGVTSWASLSQMKPRILINKTNKDFCSFLVLHTCMGILSKNSKLCYINYCLSFWDVVNIFKGGGENVHHYSSYIIYFFLFFNVCWVSVLTVIQLPSELLNFNQFPFCAYIQT
jgi:hypothetical protein